jgi:lipid-binding SYLF domain-containing protein
MKKLFLGLATLFLALVIADAAEQDTVNRCAIIIDQFQRMPEKAIPRKVLQHAKGLAVMSVVKAGCIFSAKADKVSWLLARLTAGLAPHLSPQVAGDGVFRPVPK